MSNIAELNDVWSIVLLKDICERITKGSTPTSYGYKYQDEGVRFIKAESIDSVGIASSKISYIDDETHDFLKRSILQGDDLLFSIAGTIGRVGRVRKIDLPANTNQALAIIRLKPGVVDHKYLFYYLKSDAIQKESLQKIVGVGRANLSLTNLGEFEIPLAPPEQQKHIVAEIEKQFSCLDEAVANLKRVKANLKRYKAAVLKAAVEGKLTEEWRKQHPDVESADKLLERILEERRANWRGRGKYKEPVAPEKTDLPELPVGWVWVSLGQVIDEPKYGTSKKCDYNAGDVGVLRIPNVANGVIDSNDLKTADFDEKEKQVYTLKSGDILTIRSNGSVSLVGKCALVEEKDTKYLYAGYLIRMRSSSEEVSSEYLMACLSSYLLRRQIEDKAKSTSGVNNINSGELQSLILPLCCLEEQTEIIKGVESMISIVSVAESQVDANLLRAARLRQSILKKAFSGNLI